MAQDQPPTATVRLAERLRQLREHEFTRLTQGELGRALGGAQRLSTATISVWETPASGRIPPEARLEAYALLFCTRRSFAGGTRMLEPSELTSDERERFEELRHELLGLRNSALSAGTPADRDRPQSMWHFPDGSRTTLASSHVSPDVRPRHADPAELNYVRTAGLADLDTVIDIYGAIRAYNPESRVVIKAAEDLDARDVANHLVLIGGRAWKAVRSWFSRISSLPLEADDPGERGAVVVNEPGTGKREFKCTLSDRQLIEDVGVFIRGENPTAPKRTLTICSGITTRGVRGAARCFIDPEMRERNDRYLAPRFPEGSTYCIIMRVPVVNAEPLTPDLTKEDNRLFEWSDANV